MRQHCELNLSGESFLGKLIGAPLTSSGEMVFTTGMVGYSEAITDPSYFGQILVFSYPLIGNYGIPEQIDFLARGFESHKSHLSGVIITADSEACFHWQSLKNLDRWLSDLGVPGIVGLDTRYLVQKIRDHGATFGRLTPQCEQGLRVLADEISDFDHRNDLFDPGAHSIIEMVSQKKMQTLGDGPVTIGLIDCGVKWNIIRQLLELNCKVKWYPWNGSIESGDCDGWLISNGPGDPTKTGPLVETVGELLKGDTPILGICLGHQIMSLAGGARTQQMKYGHRSHNQPVNLKGTRKGYITSQNHGFVVKDLPSEWEVWFENINDGSIEGIRHKEKPFRSVQFHPEAAGGPRDTAWILNDFITDVKNRCL